jgi:hypothetical protein
MTPEQRAYDAAGRNYSGGTRQWRAYRIGWLDGYVGSLEHLGAACGATAYHRGHDAGRAARLLDLCAPRVGGAA